MACKRDMRSVEIQANFYFIAINCTVHTWANNQIPLLAKLKRVKKLIQSFLEKILLFIKHLPRMRFFFVTMHQLNEIYVNTITSKHVVFK